MNIKLLFIPFFFSTFVISQQYDNVFIEKSKVDKNNKIYQIKNRYNFDVEIKIDNKNYYLSKINIDSLTSSTNDAIKNIALEVLKPKLFEGRTNKNQTEISYYSIPNLMFKNSTGLVENNQNIWIHPPRFGFLRSLETCPFPYIILNKPIGYKWNDAMSIGNYWSDKRWGTWDNRLLLKYNYEIIGEEIIKTPLGNLKSLKVYSSATSEIGKSILISYFNETYGFIKLEYTLFNGIKIDLNLIK